MADARVAGVATLLFAVGCGAGRDYVPESRDVRGTVSDAGAGGYEYVAKRTRGVVAVAESRGLSAEVVKHVADGLADSLEACTNRLAREGRLVPAAARVAAHIDATGTPGNLALTLTPGPGPTANALLCFVSPFKLVRFPPLAAGLPPETDRGIALEASWESLNLVPSGAAAPASSAP